MTPMESIADYEWHTFTPTMVSGYTCDEAKYMKVTDKFAYITMGFHKNTAGSIDAYIGTLPSFMRPPRFSPISAIGCLSTYTEYRSADCSINTEGKIRIYAPSSDTYYIYVAGEVPIV